ncbi:MAG: hypothetical protein GY816_08945 [Cytophagales bacterium]|nr:hypothetical protein [Cytophagales bacterium]
MKKGNYENVIVIGADTFSKTTNWERRDAVFFGDGAGAILLDLTKEDNGFIEFQLYTDGAGKYHFNIPADGSGNPATNETIEK